MKTIKVLMLGNHASVKGGITSVIGQLIKHDWKSNGIEMRFVSTYIQTNNIGKILFFIFAYLKIFFMIFTFKPDVVHIHMSYKGSFQRKYAIHKLCKKFGIKDVIHLHGSEFEKWYLESNNITQDKIRSLMRECDAFVVLGTNWHKIINRIEIQTRTIVLSNTVHIPEEKVKWNDSVFQVLFLGVLIERKGVLDLLQAVKLLADSNSLQNVCFVVAGSGIEEEKLKLASKTLGIDKYVRFTGWTAGDKKTQLLKESHMLVLPSYNEGLPIAILEAISYGLPIVSTTVGSINEAVVEDFNGYLISPGDVESLAQRMRVIFEDKEKWVEMSKNSRDTAVSRFSESKYFDNISGVYTDLAQVESRYTPI